MKQFTGLVTGFSRVLDRIAGLCLVSVMVLIVTNILFRVFLKRPILGTYEFAGFLTATVIGLALAYCAVQNGHIAVTFVMDRLSSRVQAFVDAAMNLCAFLFWVLGILGNTPTAWSPTEWFHLRRRRRFTILFISLALVCWPFAWC